MNLRIIQMMFWGIWRNLCFGCDKQTSPLHRSVVRHPDPELWANPQWVCHHVHTREYTQYTSVTFRYSKSFSEQSKQLLSIWEWDPVKHTEANPSALCDITKAAVRHADESVCMCVCVCEFECFTLKSWFSVSIRCLLTDRKLVSPFLDEADEV